MYCHHVLIRLLFPRITNVEDRIRSRPPSDKYKYCPALPFFGLNFRKERLILSVRPSGLPACMGNQMIYDGTDIDIDSTRDSGHGNYPTWMGQGAFCPPPPPPYALYAYGLPRMSVRICMDTLIDIWSNEFPIPHGLGLGSMGCLLQYVPHSHCTAYIWING